MYCFFSVYPISQKFLRILCAAFFFGIFNRPKMLTFYVPFFFRDIPFPKILKRFYTPLKKNGIFHIPKFCSTPLYRFLLGYNFWCLVYPISRKNLWNPCTIDFLGYPWNIPFLKKQKHSIDWTFYWISLGYPIFQKRKKISMYRTFFGISLGYPISQKNWPFLCTVSFLGYPWDIPYPKKVKISMYRIFLGYPWDIPYPKKLKISMYRFFFGISLGYPISQKTENFYVPEFFWDIPYPNIF